jgi:hypothetical protein
MTVFVALLNVPKFDFLIKHEHRIVKIVSLPSRIYIQIPSNVRPLRIRLFDKLETLPNALFQLIQVNGVLIYNTPNLQMFADELVDVVSDCLEMPLRCYYCFELKLTPKKIFIELFGMLFRKQPYFIESQFVEKAQSLLL